MYISKGRERKVLPMSWIAELRVDYFDNARGKFIKTETETLPIKKVEDIGKREDELKLKADKKNLNCNVHILMIREI
jgi:hypothetical protein